MLNEITDLEGFRDFEVSTRDELDRSIPGKIAGTFRVSFGIRLAAQCRHCQASLPINAFTASIVCSACGRKNNLDLRWWKQVFDEDTLPVALIRRERVGGQIRFLSLGIRIQHRRVPPGCTNCGQELSKEALHNLDPEKELRCEKCKQPLAIRPADELVQTICPGALAIVGEGPRSEDSGSEVEPVQAGPAGTPVVLQCMKCGGALEVDGSSRLVKCPYCQVQNYLPDDLWFHLHPRPIVREFYLIADLPEKTSLDWLLADSDRARAIALVTRKPGPELLRRLCAHEDDEVRQAVARWKRLTPELALQLAKDEDYDVRAGLARNPHCPPSVLELLASDTDDSVRAALARREDLESCEDATLLRLARDEEEEVRAAILTNKGFPLLRLARAIREEDELEYLRERLEQLDPPKKRSWF
ncbi:MAG: HEAT repeat domain-containing protein [Spirochaetales bacterium]|nr:HEAT repeat domain-containing protein [Leptospiraceae bacterium]MCP5483069.1 HEAT repeat domain-containing protein [Spirochaetales bacterium]MCP5486123.1 HEAT repeat domain-containing protein [Spirochaetales bacterium]